MRRVRWTSALLGIAALSITPTVLAGDASARPAPPARPSAPEETERSDSPWAIESTLPPQGPDGALQVRVRADRTTLTPAEMMRVQVIIEAPLDVEVTLPKFADELGDDWTVLSELTRTDLEADTGHAGVGQERVRRRLTCEVVIAPFLPGQRARLAWTLTARYVTGPHSGARPIVVRTLPIEVEVKSALPADGTTPELKPKPPGDALSQAGTIERESGAPILAWSIGGGAAVLGGIAIAILIRTRRERSVDPVMRAMQELETLADELQDLPEQGRVEALGIASASIRVIIERVLGVTARSRTARELASPLSAGMDAHPLLGPSLRADVQRGLEELERTAYDPSTRASAALVVGRLRDAARVLVVAQRDGPSGRSA